MDSDTHLKYGSIENVENMKVQKCTEELKYWCNYNSTLHFLHLIICQSYTWWEKENDFWRIFFEN